MINSPPRTTTSRYVSNDDATPVAMGQRIGSLNCWINEMKAVKKIQKYKSFTDRIVMVNIAIVAKFFFVENKWPPPKKDESFLCTSVLPVILLWFATTVTQGTYLVGSSTRKAVPVLYYHIAIQLRHPIDNFS